MINITINMTISMEIGKDKTREIDTTRGIIGIGIEIKIEIDSIEIEKIEKTEIEINKKINKKIKD